jgi:glycosyltransferase involved in cell wall biosynthesis
MPAYNHERFIGDTIESVLAQTFADFELVIVDDGSTDGTADAIRRFSDPRIGYHYQTNQDAFNALNRGMSLARGSYISILNSDDVYLPDRLERVLEAARRGARFVFTDVEPIDDNNLPIRGEDHPWNAWHRRNREFYFEREDLYRGFLRGNFMVSTSNMFITRELAERVGGFAPLRYLHDYDYVFRLLLEAEADTTYLHDEKLLKYRIHGGNTLSEGAITAREQDLGIIRKYMLEKVAPAERDYVKTGVDRLIELERELVDVRREIDRRRRESPPPNRPSFATRVVRGLRRTLTHGS